MVSYGIAGVQIQATTRAEVIELCRHWLTSDSAQERGVIVTPYSEFIVNAQNNLEFRNALNGASLSVPDGSGILWAGHVLYRTNRSVISVIRSLGNLALRPETIRDPFSEKVSGADLVWDIFALCQQTKARIYLLGADQEVQQRLCTLLNERYPDIELAGRYTGVVTDDTKERIRAHIQETEADVVLTALSPPFQEQWLVQEFPHLPEVRLAVGLGGTFDYITGMKSRAPYVFQQRGLEWAWRLVTQPKRLPRMYTATVRFIRIIWQARKRR